MPDPVGLFEMRRLEQLSNTIFGVAMTLLAYGMPTAPGFAQAPSWADLYHTYAQHVAALMLSFVIAGMFWVSHHRRLAIAPEGSRGTVFLNLLFLLSIIVLPAINGLYGSYRNSSVVAVLYGGHLTLIAALNGLLWIIALHRRGYRAVLAPAIFPVGVFLLGTIAAFLAPDVGPFFWFLAFAAPLMDRVTRRNGSA
jgi:uncharacterized membrane protein